MKISPQNQTRTGNAAPSAAAQNAHAPTQAPAGQAAQAPRVAGATSDGSPEATMERPRASAVRATAAAAVPTPAEVVTKFYAAFEKGDLAAMKPLYSPDVKFQDMIFSYSNREGTMHMWNKILSNPGNVLKFTLDSVEGNKVKGHWVADYTLNGRKVHNELTTEMTVENGVITRHTDKSDWNKWAPQAIPLGHLALLPGIKQLAMGLIRRTIDG